MQRPAVVFLLLAAANSFAATARYEIRYDGGRILHVEAHLPPGDGRLLIAQGGGIDHLPNQWATFVRDLHAKTIDGTEINVTARGKEGWVLSSADAVDVQYDVALDYAIEKWPAGNEQSGRLFPLALYTVTKPLFLFTSPVTDADVHFTLPAGWKIATPWDPGAGETLRASSLRRLIDNTIVIGHFSSTEIRVGAFDVTVATPGLNETPPLLAKALAQIGVVAARLFDKTPRGRYLMTFFREDDEDGESYENSAAITSPLPFDRAGMIVTGNTLVHELLHHWIGGQLAPADHDSIAWFTEGFTEYYANVAVARSGAVTPDLLMRKFNNQVSGYLYFLESPLFSGVTVGEAGRRKGAFRFGVYNSGWAVALSLDVLLRSESEGRHSLDDVMRLLYERNAMTAKPLTVTDIRSAASDIAGRDLSPFFESFVLTRNELPLAQTLAKLGIELRGQPYAADIYLIPNPSLDARQTALRKSIFGF